MEEATLEVNRRAVWGMLYADDAGVVSTLPRGLTRMMDVIVVACQKFGLTVSEKKTRAIHLWPYPIPASNALQFEPAGQRYKQTTQSVYLDGDISVSVDLDTEIKHRIVSQLSALWSLVPERASV